MPLKHSSYNSNNKLNDIALLILNQHLKLNSYIKVACIPTISFKYPFENADVVASGWVYETSLAYIKDINY